MSAVLRTHGLSLRRGAREVVAGVDLQLPAGELLMLIGPNGAGKSTLLAALAGDLAPCRGDIVFGGRALGDWDARDLARHRAMLTQRIELTLEFTVEEVVALGCQARGLRSAERARVVDAALRALDLEPLRMRVVPSLSGGEQARTHLARVLAQLWPLAPDAGAPAPRLLLLDEPCASLDPHHQHQVCQAVSRFARDSGAAVVVTMHDMNLAAQYADRILALSAGRCLAQGRPREVLTRAFVQRCFAVDAELLADGERLLVATRAGGASQA